RSLGLQAATSFSFRSYRKFRGFGRGSSFRGRFQGAQQTASSLPYRSFRGRGRVRTRGATQQHSASSSSSGG
ncbi:hypothetical protein NDU88_001336, partial [Pleurodeles waltl]